jgi:CBS domain-containing protein
MSTGVVTASTTDTVRDVVIKMLSRHCGAVPVVNASHELLGIVTLRDVMLPMYPNYGDYIHDAVHSRDFLGACPTLPFVTRRRRCSQMRDRRPGRTGGVFAGIH